jgi:hypothetical protein
MDIRRRLLPLAAACLALAPLAGAQDKGTPPDKGGTPPAAGEKAAAEPDEKDLVHEYDKAMKTKDAGARAAAVTALGDASRKLPDGGKTRYMAKALAKGLEDEDLEVQSAAVSEFSYGRDVDTTLDALGAHVENVRKEVAKRITRPDPDSKNYVNRATRLFGDSCAALANYRDDRTVSTLSDIIGRMRANTESDDSSTRLVGRIAEALLALGTLDAVTACVRQTQTYSETDGFQEPAAKELHRVLALFATRIGKAPPDYTQTYYVAWNEWLEKNKDGFPKKLGKLKDPPTSPPSQDMKQTGKTDGTDAGGAAPR